jgi:hypothetical protein
MNFTKTIFALAIGSVGIMSAMSAQAVTLNTGDQLTINAGITQVDSNGNPTQTTISWFGMDTDGNSKIAGGEKTALSMGSTGIIIGTATTQGASHTGAPTGGDTNAITAAWNFFGNTGSDYTTVGITQTGANALDMSGWTVTWAGIPAINMGGTAWGTGFSNGVGNIVFSGSNYTLDYHATVPLGDPSGFGGVKYALHLEGSVVAVPEASTYGMMMAGLGLVGFMASRRRKSI